MNQLFPYANIVSGILILIVGFVLHWISQLISILNWEFAVGKGLQEKGMPPEYKVYEHAIAVADVAIGWIYGLAGLGLILNASWGFKLAWIPGVILVYHSISFWFWNANRNRDGHQLTPQSMRIGWSLVNFGTGILTVLVAWNGF